MGTDIVVWLRVAAVIGAIAIMLFGLHNIFDRLTAKNQGFEETLGSGLTFDNRRFALRRKCGM